MVLLPSSEVDSGVLPELRYPLEQHDGRLNSCEEEGPLSPMIPLK